MREDFFPQECFNHDHCPRFFSFFFLLVISQDFLADANRVRRKSFGDREALGDKGNDSSSFLRDQNSTAFDDAQMEVNCAEGEQNGTSGFGPCIGSSQATQELVSQKATDDIKLKSMFFQEINITAVLHQKHPRHNMDNLKETQFALRFQPRGVCIQLDDQVFNTKWEIRLPVVYILRGLILLFGRQLQVNEIRIASNSSGIEEISTCYSKSLHSRSCELSFNLATFAESLEIRTSKIETKCSTLRLTNAIVLGLPMCPYFLWGPRCRKMCNCSCKTIECHPLSGSCNLQQSLACEPGFYGKRCNQKCSPICDVAPIVKGCHARSGVCKACKVARSEPYARACAPKGSRVAQALQRLLHECRAEIKIWERESFSNSIFPLLPQHVLTSQGPNPTTIISLDALANGLTLVVIAGSVLLIVFLALCCYVVVQLVKKREWRQQRDQDMDCRRTDRVSMRTVTGFDVEFREMDYSLRGKTRSFHGFRPSSPWNDLSIPDEDSVPNGVRFS